MHVKSNDDQKASVLERRKENNKLKKKKFQMDVYCFKPFRN